MCERLNRCFQAWDNMLMLKKEGRKASLPLIEDVSHSAAFLDQHMVLCTIIPSEGLDGIVKNDSTDCPVDAAEYLLLSALIETDKLMRFSVRELPMLKGISPDKKSLVPVHEDALCWVNKAGDLANQFCQSLDPDGADYRRIALQELLLTPAVDAFVQLLSQVRACQRLWRKQEPNLWRWPHKKWLDSSIEQNFCCSEIDIITALEKVQCLLRLQDASQDRLRRSNCSTARKVIKKAFIRSSKILVIRIDIGFKKCFSQEVLVENCEPETQDLITQMTLLKKFYSEFIRYIDKEFNSAFLGYVAKIEYGPKRGFHYHLIIILDGQRHQQGISLAKKIGEHWSAVITSGKGYYYNCNANKKYYKFYGIGKIHRDDDLKKSNLDKFAVDYLLKYNLPFQIFKKHGFRQFSASSRF